MVNFEKNINLQIPKYLSSKSDKSNFNTQSLTGVYFKGAEKLKRCAEASHRAKELFDSQNDDCFPIKGK